MAGFTSSVAIFFFLFTTCVNGMQRRRAVIVDSNLNGEQRRQIASEEFGANHQEAIKITDFFADTNWLMEDIFGGDRFLDGEIMMMSMSMSMQFSMSMDLSMSMDMSIDEQTEQQAMEEESMSEDMKEEGESESKDTKQEEPMSKDTKQEEPMSKDTKQEEPMSKDTKQEEPMSEDQKEESESKDTEDNTTTRSSSQGVPISNEKPSSSSGSYIALSAVVICITAAAFAIRRHSSGLFQPRGAVIDFDEEDVPESGPQSDTSVYEATGGAPTTIDVDVDVDVDQDFEEVSINDETTFECQQL